MAKRANKTPLQAEDIKKYLATEQGFQLEMSALTDCRLAGFRCSFGGSYTDPVTNIRRQYDIRASRNSPSGCFLHLAIECKSLPVEFPLLVSRVPRTEDEREICFIRTYLNPSSGIRESVIPRNNYLSIYNKGEMVGKSITRVGVHETRDKDGKLLAEEVVTGNDDVFDRWSQALSSSHGLAVAARDELGKFANGPIFSVVMPILLLNDGVLWVADYNSEGELIDEPKQVDNCEFFVDHSIDYLNYLNEVSLRYGVSHLKLLTLSGLRKFLNNGKLTDYWNYLFRLDKLKDGS